VAYQLAVGSSTVLYIGKQGSGRGTPCVADSEFNRFALVSLDVAPVIDTIPSQSLDATPDELAPATGGVTWQGTLKVEANYVGIGQSNLLGAVLGTNTTGTVTVAENGGYWTLLYNRGGMEATPLFERLSDVRFTGFTFKCAAETGAGARGIFEFTFIGSTYAVGQAVPTGTPPAAPAVSPVLFRQATVGSWCDGLRVAAGTLVYRPKAVEIAYKVPLEPSNFIMTSGTSLEPSRTGKNTCEWKFEESLMSVTPITAASTGAVNSYPLTVTFATTGVAMMFTTTAARVTSYSGPVDGAGEVREAIGWRASYHATDSGSLKIVCDYTA
jgi:hypothetical protein